ncbi:hypothetical protein GCM10022223_18650 [Kineosporia mesophila]|uniref:Uncharacterized protein n=1 Tax=Kineosporia mesophila TaxID=566012 RepID=A0ABP6ZE29_9ACTN
MLTAVPIRNQRLNITAGTVKTTRATTLSIVSQARRTAASFGEIGVHAAPSASKTSPWVLTMVRRMSHPPRRS